MKLLLVNVDANVGSTGKICEEIAKEYRAEGWSVKTAFGRDIKGEITENYYRIGDCISVYTHYVVSNIFDLHGRASKLATYRFLNWADKYDPDIVWLHNIHGYYLNYELLFSWIKKKNKKVYWTLHDEWAFTGHCACFQRIQCNKWQIMCNKCPQKEDYPRSLIIDNSRNNYQHKKKAFSGVKRLSIIVPSQWMKNTVKHSFLNQYTIEVRSNKIDESVFRPQDSSFRSSFDLGDKTILLGVAGIWTKSKGLYDFIELANRVDSSYAVVMVGVSSKIKKILPQNIIAIERTENMRELAEIYNAADFYINPSREESFSMTTLEASLCGTKSIVYSGTAAEEIAIKYNGLVIDPNVEAIMKCLKENNSK